MTEKTRVRLGAYFLFALLVAYLPNHAAIASVTIRSGATRQDAVRAVAEQHGVSTSAAEQFLSEVEHRDKKQVIEEFRVGEGAQLDFYRVKQQQMLSAPSATYEGSGYLVDRDSRLGQSYVRKLRQEQPWPVRLAMWFADLFHPRDWVVIPLGFTGVSGSPLAQVAGNSAMAGTRASEVVKIAVLIAEFPAWRDLSPENLPPLNARGTETSGDDIFYPQGGGSWTGTFSARAEYAMLGNINDAKSETEFGQWAPSAYADSAGGALSGGYPIGMAMQWDEYHYGCGPTWDGEAGYYNTPTDRNTDLKVRNYWNYFFFDLANATSVREFFYQNTHNHISISGPGSAAQGWLRTHHMLDRYPFGGAQDYTIQPGTPLIRPLPWDATYAVLRASMSQDGLTILFTQDTSSVTTITLQAHQADVSSASGNQPGTATLSPASGTTWNWVVDPYDARRWTLTNVGTAIYPDAGGGTTPRTYDDEDGGAWAITVSARQQLTGTVITPTTGSANATEARTQRHGSPDLDDTFGSNSTIFTANDVFSKDDREWRSFPGIDNPVGAPVEYPPFSLLDRQTGQATEPNTKPVRLMSDDVGNRLKHFNYYCHTHAFYQTVPGYPYQLRHLRAANTNYTDDAGGTNESTSDRVDRPYPFNYCLADNSRGNQGFYRSPGDAGHTSDDMRADIDNVCADQGITLDDYDNKVYIYPHNGAGDEHSPGMPITPHAALNGKYVVIPDSATTDLARHELGHNFGLVDLYDNDLYNNTRVQPAPNPPFFLCDTLGPFSLMADGGRIDAWHLVEPAGVDLQNGPWAQVVPVQQDRISIQIPQSELALQDPVILKLPANPYYLRDGVDPDDWEEYFLIENRYTTGSDYFGDASSPGLYIYHVDRRDFHYLPRGYTTFQVEERALSVAMEQADGLNELENSTRGATTDTAGDPFPGSTGNRSFTQLSTPSSWSHGAPQAGVGTKIIKPETPTDSFVRVVNISDPAPTMTADIYVMPREIVVTQDDSVTPPTFAQQGDTDVPILALKLDNSSAGNNLSTGNVVINQIRIRESGTNGTDLTVKRSSLFVETNDTAGLQVGASGDTRIATTALSGDYSTFTNLGLGIPLNEARIVYLTYDISPTAQSNPVITVGADLADYKQITPEVPGAVQERERLGDYQFGVYRFPIASKSTVQIYERPDVLTVTPTDMAPATAPQGTADIGLLGLNLAVNVAAVPPADSVNIKQITLNEVGDCTATTDLKLARLYKDTDKDHVLDAAEIASPLKEASFTVNGGVEQVTFQNVNLTVSGGDPQDLIVGVSLNSGATLEKHVQLRMVDTTFVELTQNPSMTAAYQDSVAATNFPMQSGPTAEAMRIVAPNTAPNRVTSGFKVDGLDESPTLTVFNQSPVLSWDAASDPDAADTPDTLSYRVELATDGSFTNIIRSVNTTSPAGTTSWAVPAPALAAGTYYWHVMTRDSQGAYATDWSDTQVFQVQLNSPPNPVTAGFDPADGTVVTVVNATDTPTPTLSWTATTDPDPGDPSNTLYYVVQVDDNSDFSSPLAIGGPATTQWTGTAGVTTMTVPASAGLQVGVTYYWRVQACDDQNAASAWSATLSFTPVVNRAPATPVGAFTPSGSVEVSSANPVLTWNMPGTPDPDSPSDRLANIHYEVQLATSADLATVTTFTFETTTAVNTLTATVNGGVSLADDTHYYWRVRSVDDQGLKSAWSAVQDFWVNSTNDTPSPPTTGWEPAEGATTNDATPALSWDNSPDPDVDITDGAFTNAAATPPIVGVSWVVELVSTPLTAAAPTTNADGSFATVTPQYTYTTGPLAAAGRPSLAVTTPLTENVWWYWHVKAVDNDGARSTTWSTLQHFRVRSDYNPPTAPTSGFVPATGSSISPDATHALRLEWNPGADTEDPITQLRYEVELSSNNTFTTTPGYYWASGLGTAARTYVDVPATPVLTAGTTYYWRVRTVDKNCLRSAWSTTQTFTVVANRAPNAVTTGFAPTGTQQISDQTPELTWNAATPPDPDADDTAATMTYQVQVDDNSAFTSPEFTGTTAVGATTINVTTTLTVGVRYYWRVLPVDRKGLAATAWSATQDFRVVANQAPAAPTSGFDPSDGEEITTATPRIQWNAGTDPNTDDTAATLTYEIQVKADPDLSSGPYAFTATTTVGGQTYVDVTTPLPDNGHFYYRIRTIDDGGLSSPWTTSALTHFYVNTDNDAPTAPTTGFNPPSGSTTNDTTPLLSWDNSTDPDPDPFDGAVTAAPVVGVHFEVQVSRSNTFVPVAYTYTTAPGVSSVQCGTLTDGVQWYWRVQTIDDDGTPSGYGPAQALFVNSAANAPTTPTGLTPGTGASVSSTTPLLSWTAGTDVDAADTAAALRYEVQVASSATFATTPYYWTSGLTPAGQTYVYVAASSPLTQGDTYYWRVRTVDTTNLYSAWSAGQQFTVVTNRAPNQVVNGFDPVSGSTITDQTPLLAWSAASPPDPDADDTAATMRYYVEVDNNADFRSPEFGPALTTLPLADPMTPSITVTTTLPVGVTYYWHVKAMDAKDLQATNWSATQNFRIVTDQAPATPIATFTPSGAIEVGPPTLTWNDPNPPSPPDPNPSDTIDTIKYDVQVSASADFSGTLVYTGQTGEGEAYMVVPAGTWVDDTHYYWRVRAVDRQGLTSAWTAIQDFWCNTGNDAPNPPTSGFSPADQSGVNDSTPRLSWDPATDPDQSDPATTLTYRVALSKDNFATVAYTYNVAVAGRTFLDVPSALTDNTTWYWHVAAIDNDGAVSAWSTTLRFNLNTSNNAPDAPLSGFVPSGGVNVSDTTPNLSWNAATDPNPTDTPDTLHYEVQLSSDNTFPSPAPAGTYFYSVTTADGIVTVTVPAANALTTGTTYYWRVRTVDSGGLVSAAWSATQTFVVGANQSPNAPTSGFSPAGGVGVSDRTPIMSWNAGTDPDANDTADVLRYNLQVDDNSDFSSPTFRATTAYGQTSIECTPAGGLAEGVTYYWRVQTQDAAGALSAWSAVQNFHVIANRAPYAPIAAFTPVSWPPINTANPTLTWSMPATPDPDPNDTLDTLKYEVQLNNKEDLANGPYVFTATTLVNVMQAVCTVNLTDNTQYWWRVRSVDAQGATSDWSDVQTFWINLSNQAPAAPDSGFDPADGEQVSDDTPLMSWIAATDADPDDTAGTLHYIVELSTSPTLATVSYQYTTADGVTQVTPTAALTDRTTWYWRVRTVDNDGAVSGWSVIQNFYLDKGNQLPTLTDPQVVQPYGALGDYYQLYVTYTDAENDAPGWVRCTFDNGVGPLDMRKVNAADNDATNGIQYVVGVAGSTLGLGAHHHAFTCQAGIRLPALATDWLTGPTIGVKSRVRLMDSRSADVTQYEEGAVIWIEVIDADQNLDPATRETVTVTVTEQNGDTEDVVLTETNVATGNFHGSIQSLGRAGASGDGVLNAIAGTSGNTVTLTYTDPDDGANPTPDTGTDTAGIVDTTPPAAVNALPTLSSGIHGRSVNVDWTSYSEDKQVDVAGYHVWISTSQFTTTAGLTALPALPAGTQTLTVTQLPSGTALAPNTTYWIAVTAFDEVPNERTAVTSQSIVTRDSTAPTIAAQNPAPGSTEVARNTPITFSLDDPGVGIDQSTLVVTLWQGSTVIGHATPTLTGDQYSYQVTVVPSAAFAWNATVRVWVDVKDFDGNQLLVNDTLGPWSFKTVTDTVLPTLDDRAPTADATNVPVTTNISFSLHDSGSGINQAATQLIFNGTDVSSSLTFTTLADGVRATYNPTTDLLYNSQYTVSATGFDNAGNSTGPVNWSFNTVVDAGAVTADLFDPARNAVGVPINTNVSFRLSDSLAGIVASSFRLWVAGSEVTGSADLTIVKVPADSDHPTTMAVSYNPPADFAYSTDVAVRLYAEDRVGNVTDMTYSFRTADAPTYNVSGIITTAAGVAIPGVTVTAGGQTATTDGNGSYRIGGLLAGAYVVMPARAEYVFTPPTASVTLGPDDAVANFTGALQTYALSGTIKEGTTPLAGVTVTCDGLTATTDANGAYRIAGLPNGTYTVTPALRNYHFQPATKAAQIISADLTGVDFEAVADTFSIGGQVKDNTGAAVEGVQITCGTKSTVTDAAGTYVVAGLRAGTYTVSAAKDGYQIVDADDSDSATISVTVPPTTTTADFTANIEMSSTFPAGLNFIGVPGLPLDTNPMNVFDLDPTQGEICYRWNPAATPPQYLVAQNDPTAAAVQVRAGRGFFVSFADTRTVRVAGTPTSTSTSIGLTNGWNMIANPLPQPVKFSSFVPTVATAVKNYAFVYDNTTGSYQMVSSDASLGAARSSILGWEGAWVRATSSGVSLTVAATAGTAADKSSMKPTQADLNGGWTLPIVARAGNRADTSSLAGVVPGSDGTQNVENPPALSHTVDVYFTDSSGAKLAHDVRSSLGSQTFTFVVACSVADADVTVTLPDLSNVPNDYQVLLTDKQTGKTLYARTVPSYSYRSSGDSSERTFELTVSPRTIGALAVTASAAQTRGSNVALTYTVTRACSMNVRVLNIAGRCIRQLVTEKAVTAGVQTELWNLCAANGTMVPSGLYLLQLEAVTDTGQRVRTMTQVRVTR